MHNHNKQVQLYWKVLLQNMTGSGIAVTTTAAAAAQLLLTDRQPLPSGVLVNCPLQPLMIRLLASCCVIVHHPFLLWHTVMGLLTLLLPVAFVLFSCCAMVRLSHLSSHPLSCNCQCSWRTLPSDTLNASHHPPLPFLSMLAWCLCHLLPDASSATCFCCALIAVAAFAAIRGMLSLGALITNRCLPLLLLRMVGCCVFCLAEAVADENFSR